MPDITPLTRNVLVIDFHPAAVPAHWNHADDLIPRYIEAMKKASNNLLVYQVVEKIESAEYPVLIDGSQYTDTTYAAVLTDPQRALRDAKGNYIPSDYLKIIQKFDLLQKVKNALIDEVWMFGGPYFGFYESRMVGKGAFWCNGPAIEQACRRFIIMGFNYERDVKEMIHDYGHRSESLLAKHFGSETFLAGIYGLQTGLASSNGYEQFLANVGTVHRKPGGAEYGQDEFAWLSAMKPEWWPPTIDPNLVQAPNPPAQVAKTSQKPWYQFILDFLGLIFGRK